MSNPETPKATRPRAKRNHRNPAEGGGCLNRQQMMAKYGWSSSTLWRAMRMLGLPYRLVGRIPIFIESEVDAWRDRLPGQKPPKSAA